jgi:hypothetical protein
MIEIQSPNQTTFSQFLISKQASLSKISQTFIYLETLELVDQEGRCKLCLVSKSTLQTSPVYILHAAYQIV